MHSDTFVSKKHDLQTIHVEFHTPENNGPARFDIDNCQGDMVPGQPLALDIEGKILEFNYTVDVSIASLKPGTEKSDAALKVVMQNFDISILVHRTKPDSEMGGMVNLDIDLQSSASSIDELLATGTVISIFQPRHSS